MSGFQPRTLFRLVTPASVPGCYMPGLQHFVVLPSKFGGDAGKPGVALASRCDASHRLCSRSRRSMDGH